MKERAEGIVNRGGGGNVDASYLTADIDPRAGCYVDMTKNLPFKREMDELGTLPLVGPIQDLRASKVARLLRHAKVRAVGAVPHTEVPQWMWGHDLALIPYRQSESNLSCSPMRQYDHLASGRPIVATDSCLQIHSFRDYLKVEDNRAGFLKYVGRPLRTDEACGRICRQLADARKHLWDGRAHAINEVVQENHVEQCVNE